ncbi:MAG TPA: zinc metallopeptidase [Bacillota bacterium]|nr:zinc metallopeptidase [Bacillota bacterium]HOG53048.1 zinc metallopeptidase [Bacillota bacterium]
MYFGFDWTMILVIPAMIFAMYAQSKVSGTFQRYLRVRASRGYTGYEVAKSILDASGASNITLDMVEGQLTDHFDPRNNKLGLSREVYSGSSVASLAVAAHETGHALQHKDGFAPLAFRNAIIPVAQIGSFLAVPLFILGMLFGAGGTLLMDIGILLFAGSVAFTVITLPVEFDASKRALQMLTAGGYMTEEEMPHAKQVLDAAALTYVASTAVALTQLLRLILLRNRRRG